MWAFLNISKKKDEYQRIVMNCNSLTNQILFRNISMKRHAMSKEPEHKTLNFVEVRVSSGLLSGVDTVADIRDENDTHENERIPRLSFELRNQQFRPKS